MSVTIINITRNENNRQIADNMLTLWGTVIRVHGEEAALPKVSSLLESLEKDCGIKWPKYIVISDGVATEEELKTLSARVLTFN